MEDLEGLTWNQVPFLAFDTETTGFSKQDRICQIAFVIGQGNATLFEYESLVNPGCSIGEGATAVHGITDQDVQRAPTFDMIKGTVLEIMGRGMPWVAHQLNFDARMMSYDISAEEWPRGIPTLCTLDFSKKHHPSLRLRPHHKLLDVAGALGINYDPEQAHTAIVDSRLLAKIVPEMMTDRLVLTNFTKRSEEWLKP